MNRELCLELFIDRVNNLNKYASSLGIKLMIENNVISSNNFKTFSCDPFLMTTLNEAQYIMKNTDSNVSLLVDVAHLKVSSVSHKKSSKLFLDSLDPYITGYHLSDNNGLSDSNDAYNNESWFWPFLKKDLDYYSIEVYTDNAIIQKEMVDLLKRNLF